MSSSIQCGIVGLPNVGKSTLFNALTSSNVLEANYPFATIEPNTGIVALPDQRLNKLAELYKTKNIVPATATFVDIAGLVEGASKGEGLGNQFLSHIRSTNAIIHVVRAFNDSNITYAGGASDPKSSIDIINTELVLADLETISRRLSKFEKEARANPKLKPTLDVLIEAKDVLNQGIPLWDKELDYFLLNDLQLLTTKPIIYLFNLDEVGLNDQQIKDDLQSFVAPAQAIFVCAKIENELKDLDEEDKLELLNSYGQNESGLNQLIKSAYSILGLQSFLTAGEKEVRAWTIKKGSTAKEAAGVIHKDFERGFIAADIVDYQNLVDAGSFQEAKATGKVRTEGKDYIMKDNDVVLFKFNVSK